jgi:hypothetical protein
VGYVVDAVLEMWRNRPVMLSSSLGPQDAVAGIRASIEQSQQEERERKRRGWVNNLMFGEVPAPIVRGFVLDDRLALVVRHPRQRDNGGTVELVADVTGRFDGGSDLRGILRPLTNIRVFSVLWLSCVALLEVFLVALVVGGRASPAAVIGPLVLFLLGLGITANIAGSARRDGIFLRDWLTKAADFTEEQ